MLADDARGTSPGRRVRRKNYFVPFMSISVLKALNTSTNRVVHHQIRLQVAFDGGRQRQKVNAVDGRAFRNHTEADLLQC